MKFFAFVSACAPLVLQLVAGSSQRWHKGIRVLQTRDAWTDLCSVNRSGFHLFIKRKRFCSAIPDASSKSERKKPAITKTERRAEGSGWPRVAGGCFTPPFSLPCSGLRGT